MYAQITYFDGPRSPELVAAGDRASRERIYPAVMADAELRSQLVAVYTLRRDDGGELTVSVANSLGAFSRARDIIMSTELLPGEDVMLLPGPDRSEIFEVVNVVTAGELAGAGAGSGDVR